VVEHKTLYDAAGINRLTALAYDGLLEALFVTGQVPAWTTNRLARVTRTAKRYLVEPALLGPLAGMDARSVLRDVDQLGRLVDTFVVSELRAELSVTELGIAMHHLRQEHGRREVDLVLEAADDRVVAVEIKATAAPTAEMARHLIWLRDALGDDLVAGVVLHTGPWPFRIDDRIHALPISSLWAHHPRR
jgi:predicted AAA+ superfamily ATPase